MTYRTVGSGQCTDGSLGESKSSSEVECQRFCSVDPRCRFVTFAPFSQILEHGGQCSWSSSCHELQSSSESTVSAKVDVTQPKGWFWASSKFKALDLSGQVILAAGNMTVAEAIRSCTTLPNCSSFGFTDAAGPLTTGSPSIVLLDGAPIIDPDMTISNSWVYYKNSSAANAFCDLKLDQRIAVEGKATAVMMEWRQCSAGLVAQLVLAGHGPVGAAVPLNSADPDGRPGPMPWERGHKAVLQLPASTRQGEKWSVCVSSANNRAQAPLLMLPLSIEKAVCNADGAWPATAATQSLSGLPCWKLNSSTWATGTASRRCELSGAKGVWGPEELGSCSNGGWSAEELGFLVEFGITDKGGERIIGGHTSRYDTSRDFFYWLAYFPGKKAWELTWNDDLWGCTSAGAYVMPGNMAAPRYRRMQLGSMIQPAILGDARPLGCARFSKSFSVSLHETNGSRTTAHLDATLNVSRSAHGNVSVQPSMSLTRLGLQVATLPFHGLSVTRFTIWDTEKAA